MRTKLNISRSSMVNSGNSRTRIGASRRSKLYGVPSETAGPSSFRLLEDDNFRILENGDFRILE